MCTALPSVPSKIHDNWRFSPFWGRVSQNGPIRLLSGNFHTLSKKTLKDIMFQSSTYVRYTFLVYFTQRKKTQLFHMIVTSYFFKQINPHIEHWFLHLLFEIFGCLYTGERRDRYPSPIISLGHLVIVSISASGTLQEGGGWDGSCISLYCIKKDAAAVDPLLHGRSSQNMCTVVSDCLRGWQE